MAEKEKPNQKTRVLKRRLRERLQRQNSIVDAAQKRFFEFGFDSVSMDDIAGDLELTKPALYRYFRNKESLYLAVVLRGMNFLRDTLRTAVEKEKSGRDKILAYVRTFLFDYSKKHADYYRLIVVAREQHFMEMFERNEVEGAREFGTMAFELLSLLVEAINVGVEDGTVRGDIEPLQTAIFLVVSMEALVNLTPDYKNLIARQSLGKDDFLGYSIGLLKHVIAK